MGCPGWREYPSDLFIRRASDTRAAAQRSMSSDEHAEGAVEDALCVGHLWELQLTAVVINCSWRLFDDMWCVHRSSLDRTPV